MFSRRIFLTLAAGSFLAACTQQVVTSEISERLDIQDVRVSFSDAAEQGASLKGVSYTSDYAKTLAEKLSVAGKQGDIPARVLVSVDTMRVIAGNKQEFAEGTFRVERISDGMLLAGPSAFRSVTTPAATSGGLIGLAVGAVANGIVSQNEKVFRRSAASLGNLTAINLRSLIFGRTAF